MFTGLLSPTHLIVLLLIMLVLFGAKRLPEIGRSLGQGLQEFREGFDNNNASEKAEGKPLEAIEQE